MLRRTNASTLTIVTGEPSSHGLVDPDPFYELTYPDALAANRSIADHLGMPLAKCERNRGKNFRGARKVSLAGPLPERLPF